MRYVAFLRGINVGGNKLIKMDALADVFRSAGFRNVKTYIASGNVIFDTRASGRDALAKKIERKLLEAFGHEITAVLVPLSELESLVAKNPFKRIKNGRDVMLFVTLLGKPVSPPKEQIESITDKLEVDEVRDRATFPVARRKATGWFGFPNNFIEKVFRVPATTRNWSTLEKIVVVASSEKSRQ